MTRRAVEEAGEAIPLRIVVLGPPAGVLFAVQRGRFELEAPTVAAGEQITFEFALRRGQGVAGELELRGPQVQGPRGARFVYLCSGTYAGQADSCWARRAKIPLSGISNAILGRLATAAPAILEARIAGLAKDGGPACATVPLLGGGWTVQQAT